MEKLSADAKAKIAENYVSTVVARINCEWHPRSDKAYGLDGEIELKRHNQRTGRILSVQVRAGLSYLKSETKRELIFKVKREHLEYWGKYSTPVLFVWYSLDERKAYWTCANSKSMRFEHSDIQVPKSSKFGIHSLGDLRRVLSISEMGHFLNRTLWHNQVALTSSLRPWL